MEQEIHLESMKAVCKATGEPSSSLLNIIDLERYSSLNKLLAVTSCVIRFLTNCKSGEKDPKFGPFTTQELSIAMTLWIKAVQGQAFSHEIQQLSRKDTKLSLPLIRQLCLYLDDKISEGQAFSTTGVDYAGPLYVKSSTGDRSSTKVYIALFTCAVVRAVHLEVAEDLSSESFIRADGKFQKADGEFQKDLSQITQKTSRTVARGSLSCLVRFWRQRKPKDTWQVME